MLLLLLFHRLLVVKLANRERRCRFGLIPPAVEEPEQKSSNDCYTADGGGCKATNRAFGQTTGCGFVPGLFRLGSL
jgi:hypothetical protein